MIVRSRRLGVALAAVLATAGCLGPAEPARPHPAGRKVTVVRGEETYQVTAEVLDWETRPHPQVPDQGDAVLGTYRFTGKGMTTIELQICAVDDKRVVIMCDSVFTIELSYLDDTQEGEFTIGPKGPGADDDLSKTAEVLLVPDQMDPGPHYGDPKDHDGYEPPEYLRPGDQL